MKLSNISSFLGAVVNELRSIENILATGTVVVGAVLGTTNGPVVVRLLGLGAATIGSVVALLVNAQKDISTLTKPSK